MLRAAVPVAALLLAACMELPFRGYEVPRLPEEPVLAAFSPFAAGLERRSPDLLAAPFAPGVRGRAPGRRLPTAPPAHRWEPGGAAEGREELLRAWQAYLEGFRAVARVELKPRGFDVAPGEARAALLLDLRGVDLDGRFRNDRFRLEARLRQEGDDWLIVELEVASGEGSSGTRARFRDIAREAGAAVPHSIQDPGAGAGLLHPSVNADSGLAVGDVDGDGWPDLFLCDGRRNVLLRNRGNGTFEDVTLRAGLEGPSALTRSALFFDADNDGDLDLVVAADRTPLALYRNLGDGRFERVAGSGLELAGFPTSMAAADVDGDGYLDLHVAQYGDASNVFPALEERNGLPNLLFRNLGGLRFRECAREAGVDDRGWTFSAAFSDVDGDGDADLFTCNDWGSSALYLNDGRGRFRDATPAWGVAGPAFGMSADFGDYDGDGSLDLLAAGMYSNAGQWLFKKRELLPVPWFLSGIRTRVLGALDSMTDGNRLFRNEGGRFSERARPAGVDYGQFGWGASWVDVDNDGRLDIYACTGFWSGADPEDT